jgi:hypothetical protein
MSESQSQLNLTELIFLKSVLENKIEELESKGEPLGPLTDALRKVKSQREAILTSNWQESNRA